MKSFLIGLQDTNFDLRKKLLNYMKENSDALKPRWIRNYELFNKRFPDFQFDLEENVC